MIDKVKAMNLISRNKSVFQHDEGMTKALNLAIKVLEERPQGEWIEGKKAILSAINVDVKLDTRTLLVINLIIPNFVAIAEQK